MNKIITFVTALSIASFGVTPSSADQQYAVAVIDSGFESSQFSNSVVQEVCVTETHGCNNRKNFDIGSGSAGSPVAIRERSLEDWNHGTEMVKNILSVNPQAKLVLIRNSKTYGPTVFPGTEKDFEAALRWVYDNASTYNIVAVSFSRGSHKYVQSNKQVSRLMGTIKIYQGMVDRLKATNNRLAPIFEKKLNDLKSQLYSMGNIECPVDQQLQNLISDLQVINVATIVATGNDADKTYADYPACIDEAVAVAAADSSGNLIYVSNTGHNTDFAIEAPTTSEATARLAGRWSLMYNGSYNSTYELIINSGSVSSSLSTVFVP